MCMRLRIKGWTNFVLSHFHKRHEYPSFLMHGGLRIDSVVDAHRRDAENVPRMLGVGSEKRAATCAMLAVVAWRRIRHREPGAQ
jgi:hypothetical protein